MLGAGSRPWTSGGQVGKGPGARGAVRGFRVQGQDGPCSHKGTVSRHPDGWGLSRSNISE